MEGEGEEDNGIPLAPGLPGPRKPRNDEAAAAAAAVLPKLMRRAKGVGCAVRVAASSSSTMALSSKVSPEPLLLVLRLARRRAAAHPKAAVAVGLVPAGDRPSVV